MVRRKTPDLIGEIMTSKPPNNKAIKQSNKLNQTYIKGTSPQEKRDSLRKEKATFNLEKGLLDNLEAAWFDIRKIRGDKKISKTHLVQQSLCDCLEDFRRNGEKSEFYLKLVRKIENSR